MLPSSPSLFFVSAPPAHYMLCMGVSVRAFANWQCGHGRKGPARAWENDATRIHVNECMYTILWE